jgi:orotate phosphoribosyltransferase
MGLKSGDKSRYFRKRRKKLARREEMRALRKELAEKLAKAEPEAAS